MKNWKKITIASLILAGSLITTPVFKSSSNLNTNFFASAYVVENEIKSTSTQVTILNPSLDAAIRHLLGKTSTDRLYSNDFINHDDYKPYEKDVEGVMITTANKNCLDLSRTGVTDITELIKFEFPETLISINLAENGITYEDAIRINDILSLTPESENITMGEETFEIKSDFTNFAKVNLAFNDISGDKIADLEQKPNASKFIYGIQCMPSLHSSGLVLGEELANAYYFIKDNDGNYLSITIEDDLDNKLHNMDISQVNKFTESTYLGEFKIKITSVPNSETSYFKDYAKELKFKLITIKIDDNYVINRKSSFSIPKNKYITTGLTQNAIITHHNASTNTVGTFQANVDVVDGEYSRTIPLEYRVVDNTAPTITLLGQKTIYLKKNRAFVDPGVIGIDDDDNISSRVQSDAHISLDVTTLGQYTITYTLTDLNGNHATPVTRIVIVKENVLDTINLRCNTEELFTESEIMLEVKPSEGTPISDYTNYTYVWYIDGNELVETHGDNVTAKSTLAHKFSIGGTHEIYVKLTAIYNGTIIEITSNTLTLNVENKLSDNTAILLACAIAILIIILIILFITIIKHKKSKNKTHKVKSNRNKNSNRSSSKKATTKKNTDNSNKSTPEKADIQVIKDYDPNKKVGDKTSSNTQTKDTNTDKSN